MHRFYDCFRALIRDQKGATIIEYGLIAMLIAIAVILAVTSLGQEVTNSYDYVAEEVEKAKEEEPQP